MLKVRPLMIKCCKQTIFQHLSHQIHNESHIFKPNILITGGLGQLGITLASRLRERYGRDKIILSDIKKPPADVLESGPFTFVDILDKSRLRKLVVENRIDWVIHLSAILSAVGERNVPLAMKINIQGFDFMLELAKDYGLKLFIPSTIGAFGSSTPRNPTPDVTVQRPTTIYGVAKVHSELMGEYYHHKYGVDFRSLRLPGIISRGKPGGGTTDYAVEIFTDAILRGQHTCCLRSDTCLPMMYIDDCMRAICEFLATPDHKLTLRTYNITATSFSPAELADEIRKYIPDFTVTYEPDPSLQAIADTWPQVFDDSTARADWGWKHEHGLEDICRIMIENVQQGLRE